MLFRSFVIAVLILTSVFESHIYYISSLFIGFIIFAIPIVIKEEKKCLGTNKKAIPFVLLGIAVVCAITYFNPVSGGNDGVNLDHLTPGLAVFVFFAGVIAISAMVLPGCFLVDMLFHMAFFGMNRAEEIMQEYNYEAWYLGGHSLGGAMAANFAADYVEDHTDGIRGLLLLAAYPTKDLSTSDMSVVTIYGSEDGVLNMDKIVAGRELMPQDYKEVCIEGGNHAQFGSYGAQKGDGTAAIPAEEQWARTVEVFIE